MGCKFHRILMFFVPLLYALETRFLKRSKYGIVVWATEYLLPTFLALLLVHMQQSGWTKWLIAILAVYNLYEIGYIQNDCETIKKENNPTIRLSSLELCFYERWKLFIYGFRLFLGIIATIYFFSMGVDVMVLITYWLIVPFYLIYNNIRGRINLYMIFLLTAYRYVVPLLLVTDINNSRGVAMTIAVVISYPFLKWVEICAGGKSLPQEKWTRLFLKQYDSRFSFRIKYYFVITLLFVGIHLLGECAWFWPLPLYFLLLRSCQLNMPKLGAR